MRDAGGQTGRAGARGLMRCREGGAETSVRRYFKNKFTQFGIIAAYIKPERLKEIPY